MSISPYYKYLHFYQTASVVATHIRDYTSAHNEWLNTNTVHPQKLHWFSAEIVQIDKKKTVDMSTRRAKSRNSLSRLVLGNFKRRQNIVSSHAFSCDLTKSMSCCAVLWCAVMCYAVQLCCVVLCLYDVRMSLNERSHINKK